MSESPLSGGVLSEYIGAAMQAATIKTLDSGELFGEISYCPGVWASGESREKVVQQLQEVLEEWIVLSLSDGVEPPPITSHHIRIPHLVESDFS